MGGAIFDLDSIRLREIASSIQKQKLETLTNTTLSKPVLNTDSTRSAVIFDYLQGTVKEVQNISQLFQQQGWKVESKLGEAALEEQIRALEKSTAPSILHLATHGYFFGKLKEGRKVPSNTRGNIMTASNPLIRSGLALTGANYAWKEGKRMKGLEDGILTAYEIASLNLMATELVVLSACETALGDVVDGEGIFGLQRAFKTAGVEEMLISLWKVPDTQTVELMQHFYQFYLNHFDASRALHQAQLKMSKKYRAFYWAGFVLVK